MLNITELFLFRGLRATMGGVMVTSVNSRQENTSQAGLKPGRGPRWYYVDLISTLELSVGEDCLEAFSLGLPDIKGISCHHCPFMKISLRDDIYLDCHPPVEIHLRNKIYRLWTQRKRRHYISSPGPLICPQQASEIKSSLYIIHSRQSYCRAGGAGTGAKERRGQARETRRTREKLGRMEREKKERSSG